MISQALRGLIGQNMSGRKSRPVLRRMIIQGAGTAGGGNSGTYTAEEDFDLQLFVWGGGASGNSSNTANLGGGGAAAGYLHRIFPRGKVLSWTLGAPGVPTNSNPSDISGVAGADSTVTLDGVTMTAQGGFAPTASVAAGRALATGFDINRYGGGSGERGEFGYTDGTSPTTVAGGGGGGFGDLLGAFTAGVGLQSSGTVPNHAAFGCGGRGQDHTTYSGGGGEPMLLAFLYRLNG